jgi:hypothetical protein
MGTKLRVAYLAPLRSANVLLRETSDTLVTLSEMQTKRIYILYQLNHIKEKK